MLINKTTLQSLGYSYTKAHDLMNQLCRQLPYTSKQVYVKTVRHENSEMLQILRSVEASDVIAMCDEKIAKAKTNKRINSEQWVKLKIKLENISKNT